MFPINIRLNKYVIKLFYLFLNATKIKKCVVQLLIITLKHQNLTLTAIWLKKCVIKLSVLISLQYNLFLIVIRLRKQVTKLSIDGFLHYLYSWSLKNSEFDRVTSEDPFMLVYCLERYKSGRITDEAVDDC